MICLILRKCIVLVSEIIDKHQVLRVLSIRARLLSNTWMDSISIFTSVQFLFQNLFLFSLLFNLSSFLCIFVNFYDSDNSKKFNNTHSPSCCSWSLWLSCQLGQRCAFTSWKNDVRNEVYIEHYRSSWDKIQEEKEGKEIALDVDWTQDDLNGKNSHD